MKILAIDTSCDETAVAIVENTKVCSNIIWSQASLHAKFGGVIPSLAQRAHEERIDYIVNKAIAQTHGIKLQDLDAIAVTIGPGLAISLGVGINKAKELARKYKLPLIPINHVEAHLLSTLAQPRTEKENIKNIKFPAYGLVLSGGTTLLLLVNTIGNYKILAQTSDDALGEALDKAARLLGFGYPGGAILEKFAKFGDPEKFTLPLPLVNDKIKNRFSYSWLKTAFVKKVGEIKNPSKQNIFDLAACFQDVAFTHVLKVLDYQINNRVKAVNTLLLGGGVANNILLKNRLRNTCKKYNISFHVPYTKKINGDNAAMVGVCAYLKIKTQGLKIKKYLDYNSVDRNPNFKI